jgi:uncharacterized peroxidase-related enzyme
MAYVNEVDVSKAEPRLGAIYERLQEMLGYVPHYFQALGTKPDVIEAQLAMDGAVMAEGALTTSVKEQIGLVVSGINSSAYCIAFHMELLHKGFGLPKPVAKKLAVDYENAPGDEKTKSLFRFADKLTRKPLEIEAEDVETLRAAGWGDEAVRETVLTVAYFNYINRVSFGLGLVGDL